MQPKTKYNWAYMEYSTAELTLWSQQYLLFNENHGIVQSNETFIKSINEMQLPRFDETIRLQQTIVDWMGHGHKNLIKKYI